MIGDWMGSIYHMGGQRCDWHLFLDHNGRYERTIRLEGDEHRDTGQWEHDETNHVLRLHSDISNENGRVSSQWSVLSVTTCEDSNVLLVLRAVVLASRNLPMVLYRVHCNGRGYGTDWDKGIAGPGEGSILFPPGERGE